MGRTLRVKVMKKTGCLARLHGARAFTLTELLISLTIIALLAAIILPVFSQAKMRANQTASISNAKQIVLAGQLYYEESGRMPLRAVRLYPRLVTSCGVLASPLDTSAEGHWNLARHGEIAPAGCRISYFTPEDFSLGGADMSAYSDLINESIIAGKSAWIADFSPLVTARDYALRDKIDFPGFLNEGPVIRGWFDGHVSVDRFGSTCPDGSRGPFDTRWVFRTQTSEEQAEICANPEGS